MASRTSLGPLGIPLPVRELFATGIEDAVAVAAIVVAAAGASGIPEAAYTSLHPSGLPGVRYQVNGVDIATPTVGAASASVSVSGIGTDGTLIPLTGLSPLALPGLYNNADLDREATSWVVDMSAAVNATITDFDSYAFTLVADAIPTGTYATSAAYSQTVGAATATVTPLGYSGSSGSVTNTVTAVGYGTSITFLFGSGVGQIVNTVTPLATSALLWSGNGSITATVTAEGELSADFDSVGAADASVSVLGIGLQDSASGGECLVTVTVNGDSLGIQTVEASGATDISLTVTGAGSSKSWAAAATETDNWVEADSSDYYLLTESSLYLTTEGGYRLQSDDPPITDIWTIVRY